MQCPNCHQIDQVQSASAIYQAGTTHSTGKSRSTSFFGPTYTHNLRSSHQTTLARRLAPPQNKTVQQIFTALLCFGSMEFFWRVIHDHIQKTGSGRLPLDYNTGLFLMNLFLAIFIIRIVINARQRAVRMKRWHNLWYCHRCNHEFVAKAAV